MKKKNLKTLKINKQLISRINNTSVIGGGTRGCDHTVPCYLTTACPTESQETDCYTINPLRCIAPPNPA